jgi:signal transduction histidine kinase
MSSVPKVQPYRIYKTTAFRLAVLYLLAFASLIVVVFGYILYETRVIFEVQFRENLTEEVRDLSRQYRRGGLLLLRNTINRRSRLPGANVYLLLGPDRQILAGNLTDIPQSLPLKNGLHRFSYAQGHRPQSLNPPASRSGMPLRRWLERDGVTPPPPHRAMFDQSGEAVGRIFQLQGGYTLLVGRDIASGLTFRSILVRAFLVSGFLLIVLAGVGWWMIRSRILKPLESFTRTSQQIMQGDLSQRLSPTRRGDEFDHLASQLNAMLARIEELMQGLKEVSDNIAHDLKTPLTRMHGRLEAALRRDPEQDEDRHVLEDTLCEAHDIIKTFDALLLIARVEAGSRKQARETITLNESVQDIAELYEPVAEDQGLLLKTNLPEQPVVMQANKELISQALANLLDNALKYSFPTHQPDIILALSSDEDGIRLSVADHGPGIAEKDRERVTRRFVRLDQSRSSEGSGLGLSLVSAIARFHGGILLLEDHNPGLKAVLYFPYPDIKS